MLNEPCQGSWAAGGVPGVHPSARPAQLQDQPCRAQRPGPQPRRIDSDKPVRARFDRCRSRSGELASLCCLCPLRRWGRQENGRATGGPDGLASLAGSTVVAIATTETWEAARQRFARLLGRGDPDRTKLAERQLAETHDQIAAAVGTDAESIRSGLVTQWVRRLADLLEEDPGVEVDLRALVEGIQAALPGGMVTAAAQPVAARRQARTGR